MADDLHIARFSDEEFERMIGSGAFGDIRVELRGGGLHRMSPQYLDHGRVKHEIARQLERGIQDASLQLEVLTEVSVRFGGGFMPLPDVSVLRPTDETKAIPGSEIALIVEAADTTLADDLGAKLVNYASAGVPECWVADLQGKAVHQAWQASGDAYLQRRLVPFGQTLEAATLPGVTLRQILSRWAVR
jgi:Uma2 family endonuclease